MAAGRSLAVLAGVLVVASAWQAEAASPETLTAVRATTPPTIDGTLDDEVWRGDALPTGTWRSYNPLYGDTVPQKTSVWAAYDDRFLYFAFQCDDPEPGRIKTSITRRDNIWSDDWVGVSLDALGTGQTAYHLMVNPSGVQLDMLNTSGAGEDESPDWVWDSAGRLTDTGYVVEIRVPLESIRFSGGDRVEMGILFWRRVSRLGVSLSWPALAPNEWVFQHHARLVFTGLEARLTRELIPSVTYSGQQQRASSDAWREVDDQFDVGISGKIGLTATTTLEATVNPDFSQVESDAFQVEVNQRYPVFFSEKRPFFMEGAGLFALAGVGEGDASMRTAVHTRRIVDPTFGVKLTGARGRWAFGTLVADDQAPGRAVAPDDPLSGEHQQFVVGRAQYSFSPSSFAGVLVTDTEFGDGFNRVAGADVKLNFPGGQTLTGMVLASATREVGDGRRRSGAATQWKYGISSLRFDFQGQVEHYDRDFRMDTAFYARTGFTNGWVYAGWNLYPDKQKHGWIHRVVPFTFTQYGRDRIQDGNELINATGVRMHFTRQGFLRVDRISGYEPWLGTQYGIGRTRVMGEVQVVRWFRAEADFSAGEATFYDLLAPFAGESRVTSLELVFQPGARFSESVEVERVDFDRAGTGADVFDVTVVNTRSTYQFSRQLFARAIVQYDSSRRTVLTDLLGSYELRPGTVVFVGYGSLVERGTWHDDEWVTGSGRYRVVRRGLFLKASYLHRF